VRMSLAPFDAPEAIRLNESRKAFLHSILRGLGGYGATALDVGAGFGYFARYLRDSGLKVTAIDVRPENVAEARIRYPDIDFRQCDVEDPSLCKLGSFDLVLCFGLLYHLENPFRAIRNLYSLTEKFLIIESQTAPSQSLAAYFYEEPKAQDQSLNFTVLMPTEACLVKMLYKAGFCAVYRPYGLPDHPEFHSSFIRRRVRTILIACKTHSNLGAYCYVPEPRSAQLSLRNWHNAIGKTLAMSRDCVLSFAKKVGKVIPHTLVAGLCAASAANVPDLKVWPGWVLGSTQPSKRFSPLIRKFLWILFSAKPTRRPMILKWHNGIRVLAYPDDETSRALFVSGCYEPNQLHFLSRVLKPGSTFVDVGAHIGLYSLLAARLVGREGIVLALEPSDREFRRLKTNLALNHAANVRPRQVAVFNRETDMDLLIASPPFSGHNTLGDFVYDHTRLEKKQLVHTKRLDDLIVGEGLRRVDVIKMDIEGAELFGLEGAIHTLRRFRPILLFELSDRTLARQGCKSQQVWDRVTSLGYSIHLFDGWTGLPTTARRCPAFVDSESVIAVPRQ
jgi:FkbM family methyltransferase